MARFIDRYVRRPIQAMLAAVPNLDQIPSLKLSVHGETLTFALGEEEVDIVRHPADPDQEEDE